MIGPLLDRGRAIHADLMTDQCIIRRSTRGVLDETTGRYLDLVTVVYTGPCRLKIAAAGTVDVATAAVERSRPVLELPWEDVDRRDYVGGYWDAYGASAMRIETGDLVAIVTGQFAGRTATVYADLPASTATARRFTVELTS